MPVLGDRSSGNQVPIPVVNDKLDYLFLCHIRPEDWGLILGPRHNVHLKRKCVLMVIGW